MAKKKKRSRGSNITQQAFKWIRVGNLIAPALNRSARFGAWEKKIAGPIQAYGAWNIETNSFDPGLLTEMWGPYTLTTLITHGISKLTGIIRRL